MPKQQTRKLRLMSSEHTEQYIAIAKAMLDDVGIACTKWYNRQSACTTNHFPWPVLLFNFRETESCAIRDERNRVKKTLEYANVANSPVLEKQLMAQVKDRVHQSRAQKGEDLRATARQLGHLELDGRFSFEGTNQKCRFVLGTDCMLCGIQGHDVPRCPEFLAAHEIKHGQPYVGPAAIIVPNSPPFPHPIVTSQDHIHNTIFTGPGQQVLVQGSFLGYATVSADGESVNMELQLSSGHSWDGCRSVDLSGCSLAIESGRFVGLENFQRAGIQAEDGRGQEGGYNADGIGGDEQGRAMYGGGQQGRYDAYRPGNGVEQVGQGSEYMEMREEDDGYERGEQVSEYVEMREEDGACSGDKWL